jgi:hypothetical protein
MEAKKISLILVSKSWNGKRTLKSRGVFETREVAQAEKTRLIEASSKMGNYPDYRVLGPVQIKALQEEIKGEQDARRAKGRAKAALTRAKTPKGRSLRVLSHLRCKVQEAVLRDGWPPDATVPTWTHFRVRQVVVRPRLLGTCPDGAGRPGVGDQTPGEVKDLHRSW